MKIKAKIVGQNKWVFITLDREDYLKFLNFKWYVHQDGYAYRSGWKNGKTQNKRMHRLIMGDVPNTIVDHINFDKLDNRKTNLRFCTIAESNAHTRMRKDNTTGYRGVIRQKIVKSTPWLARIKKEGNYISLGSFETKIKAAKAYNKMAKKLYGKFAVLNQI